MHAKSDSEVSVEQSWGARSPRRPLYYVQSPSNHDVEKMSYGSSPLASPHHYYHSSPIHHSRESSTSRFSVSLKNPKNLSTWKKLHQSHHSDDADDDDDQTALQDSGHNIRLYFCFLLLFVLLFTAFSFILWGASRSYDPKVFVKDIVFEDLNIQAGNDATGVPTDMLSLKSTVKILYRNPATFFGVHVTSTPLQLHYYQLNIASGQMKGFYQSRKSGRKIVVVVSGHQVPLYGGVSVLGDARQQKENLALPLNLTFVMRSRAYILGRLVRSKFYRTIRCPVTVHGNKLGKPLNLTHSCLYN
ncbi:Late embryogenesis abundant protein [Senna tora]|uniref:Late embryogenesis abundant protein n=1 Tax=Senna tora TaxID=362788 RepID=A0A834SW53_9FABA|nr:Late embryogenesis abundant protein [Senna tora]